MDYKSVSHKSGTILLNKNGSHYQLLENMYNDYAIFQCVQTQQFIVAWGTRTRDDGIIEWASGTYFGANKDAAYHRFADRAYDIDVAGEVQFHAMTNRQYVLGHMASVQGDGHFTIHVSNGQKPYDIEIYEKPEYNGDVWAWKIDTQIFSKDEWAADYLDGLINEKQTGIRHINHPKQAIPELCGDGSFCRTKRRGYESMLCCDCPIAEQMRADRDGVSLVYQESLQEAAPVISAE